MEKIVVCFYVWVLYCIYEDVFNYFIRFDLYYKDLDFFKIIGMMLKCFNMYFCGVFLFWICIIDLVIYFFCVWL